MYNIDVCGICRDSLSSSETRVLPCNHPFHTECVNAWLERVQSCPFCRVHVKHERTSTRVDVLLLGDGDAFSDNIEIESDWDSESVSTQMSDYDRDDVDSSETDTEDYETDSGDDQVNFESVVNMSGEHPNVVNALRNYNYRTNFWIDFSENYELTLVAIEAYMRNTQEFSHTVVDNFIICQVLTNEFILRNISRLDCELLVVFQSAVMTPQTLSLVEERLEREEF